MRPCLRVLCENSLRALRFKVFAGKAETPSSPRKAAENAEKADCYAYLSMLP